MFVIIIIKQTKAHNTEWQQQQHSSTAAVLPAFIYLPTLITNIIVT